MKKTMANLALLGSVLISAAVLAPLFHSFDQGTKMGLWVDQTGPSNLATADMITRAEMSTGLLGQETRTLPKFCAQPGQITGLVCQVFAPYLTYE